jgi:2-keto-4-pentenoate hydratase
MDRITAACDYLFDMRLLQRKEASLPAEVVPQSIADGYQVQALTVKKLLARSGGQTIGYKAACTSKLAQQQLGVDGPFFGRLLSHSSHCSSVKLSASDFTVRVVEAEFAFEMGKDVPAGTVHTADTIKDFIGAAMPSIEVVDHRYHDWKAVGAPSLIADNAIHGAWIEGKPFAGWRELDFPNHAVSLVVNGETVRRGSGAAVLGNPLSVVAWLANELARFGQQLRRGDKVTTGTAIDVYPASSGDSITAEFGVLGNVELIFVS